VKNRVKDFSSRPDLAFAFKLKLSSSIIAKPEEAQNLVSAVFSGPRAVLSLQDSCRITALGILIKHFRYHFLSLLVSQRQMHESGDLNLRLQ
jgi:hypothetical protein